MRNDHFHHFLKEIHAVYGDKGKILLHVDGGSPEGCSFFKNSANFICESVLTPDKSRYPVVMGQLLKGTERYHGLCCGRGKRFSGDFLFEIDLILKEIEKLRTVESFVNTNDICSNMVFMGVPHLKPAYLDLLCDLAIAENKLLTLIANYQYTGGRLDTMWEYGPKLKSYIELPSSPDILYERYPTENNKSRHDLVEFDPHVVKKAISGATGRKIRYHRMDMGLYHLIPLTNDWIKVMNMPHEVIEANTIKFFNEKSLLGLN